MLRPAFVLLLTIYCSFTFAQTPYWQWGRGGDCQWCSMLAGGITTDLRGNTYIVGEFGSYNSASNVVFGNYDLVTIGSMYNCYIVKYDPLGNVIWGNRLEGLQSGNVYGVSVCTDIFSNLYMTGYIDGNSITIGNIILTNPNPGTTNMFIVKYDSAGNILWANMPRGRGDNYPVQLATDQTGDVYITGEFSSPYVIWGNDSLHNDSYYLFVTHKPQAFVVKYDKNGNIVWAQKAGSPDSYSNGLCTDSKGNIYLSGYFKSTSTIFGFDTLINTTFNGIFITRYDSSGNVLWAKTAIGNARSGGVCADLVGHVYLSGCFNSNTIVFDSTTLVNNINSSQNIFIAKYDTTGLLLWAVSSQGVGIDTVSGIVTTRTGDIYLTGSYTGVSTVFGNDTLYSNNPLKQSIYIAKYNLLGQVKWAKTVSGMGTEVANAISIGPDGSPLIGGYYSNQITFGNDTLPYANFQNVFIAKLDTNIATEISTIPPTFPISIYPNPSAGAFYFKGAPQGSSIEVYNIMGQNVSSSFVITAETAIVNLSNRPAGVYFYRVVNSGLAMQQGKLVVE